MITPSIQAVETTRCGFCKKSGGCGSTTRCFHFENSREGFLHFAGHEQEIAGVRALTSLRVVMQGECIYKVEGSEHKVAEGECIILNDGDEFDLHMSGGASKITTICFAEQRTADIVRAESLTDEQLIDLPEVASAGQLHFPRRVFRPDPSMLAMVRSLDPGELRSEVYDALFSGLYRRMLRTHSSAIRSIADLTAKRASVRVEIERRLTMALEYMQANLQEPLDLAQLALVASMSKHHFARSFKQAYGSTPYQMLVQQRLSAARVEIERGEATITAIAQRYQFSTVHHFSKAFKHQYHAAPSTFLPKP